MNIIHELTRHRGRELPDSMVLSPFREGIRTTAFAVAVAFVTIILESPGEVLSSSRDSRFYLVLVATLLAVSVIGFASAYLGSRIGRRSATAIVKVIIAAILFPVLIVIAAYSLLSP